MQRHTYDPAAIEPKWQNIWEERKTFRTPDDPKAWEGKPKYYILDMFPYTSRRRASYWTSRRLYSYRCVGAYETYARL